MTLEVPVQLRAALNGRSGLAAGRQRDVSLVIVTAGPAGSFRRPNAGRDYIKPCAVSPNLLSASLKWFCWRMPAGVHGMAGFDTRSRVGSQEERGKLSSTLVAREEGLRRIQEELHFNLRVPGSNPGRAFKAR